MKLLELAIRTLCDVKADRVADAVFLYSQTLDNQNSVLSAARQLLEYRLAQKVIISHSGPKSGYPGYPAWKKELQDRGVAEELILGVDLAGAASLNTLIEANAMIQFAKRKQYRDIYISAAPFHQLRAFMTSVTAALKYYPRINIYSYCGNALPWLDRVAHSQGETLGSRKELIHGEFGRILKYQNKGDLAADEAILNYLDARDRDGGPDTSF
jgi:hypothetical protein